MCIVCIKEQGVIISFQLEEMSDLKKACLPALCTTGVWWYPSSTETAARSSTIICHPAGNRVLEYLYSQQVWLSLAFSNIQAIWFKQCGLLFIHGDQDLTGILLQLIDHIDTNILNSVVPFCTRSIY